jgi:hypothetical protein
MRPFERSDWGYVVGALIGAGLLSLIWWGQSSSAKADVLPAPYDYTNCSYAEAPADRAVQVVVRPDGKLAACWSKPATNAHGAVMVCVLLEAGDPLWCSLPAKRQ